jgi:serine/threonine protein kinase
VLLLQDVVIKETAVMAGMRHPNVLPLLAAFVEGGSLWMVLPFYAAGSLLSIVQYRHPEVRSETLLHVSTSRTPHGSCDVPAASLGVCCS